MLTFFSCDKDYPRYENEAQILFEAKAKTINVTASTATIPVAIQLVADGAQGAINASIAVDPATNCASAVTVPTSAVIEAGRFVTTLNIAVDYNQLVAGNSNKLVLNLSSASVKVGENYKTITLTLNKQ